MSTRLTVYPKGSHDFYAGWTVTAQHENGQTFYTSYKKVKTGLLSHQWMAVFEGLPPGNYVVHSGGSEYDKKVVTVMPSGPAEVRFVK